MQMKPGLCYQGILGASNSVRSIEHLASSYSILGEVISPRELIVQEPFLKKQRRKRKQKMHEFTRYYLLESYPYTKSVSLDNTFTHTKITIYLNYD